MDHGVRNPSPRDPSSPAGEGVADPGGTDAPARPVSDQGTATMAVELPDSSLLGRSPYYELTKPGITGFVMISTGVSYYVAARGAADLIPFVHTLLGTGLATGGALALNQYFERDVDALMVRTRSRPLPSGRLSPGRARAFGSLLLLLGVSYLVAFVGWVPALLTITSAVLYNGVYTPLKSRSYLATLAGAVPGAAPALIGWSAYTGGFELGGLVLFSIAFLWQLPHVLALAWLLKEDYARAGFYLSPPTDPAGKGLGRQMILYCTALIPVSVFPTLLGLTGAIYLAGAVLLGVMLLAASIAAWREMSRVAARRVFLGSLAYQPILLVLMLADTVRV